MFYGTDDYPITKALGRGSGGIAKIGGQRGLFLFLVGVISGGTALFTLVIAPSESLTGISTLSSSSWEAQLLGHKVSTFHSVQFLDANSPVHSAQDVLGTLRKRDAEDGTMSSEKGSVVLRLLGEQRKGRGNNVKGKLREIGSNSIDRAAFPEISRGQVPAPVGQSQPGAGNVSNMAEPVNEAKGGMGEEHEADKAADGFPPLSGLQQGQMPETWVASGRSPRKVSVEMMDKARRGMEQRKVLAAAERGVGGKTLLEDAPRSLNPNADSTTSARVNAR